MITLLAQADAATLEAPHIDWAALSPVLALTIGACVVLVAGLLRAPGARFQAVPWLTIVTLAVTAGLAVWQWDREVDIVMNAMRGDNLTWAMTVLFSVAGIFAVMLSMGDLGPREAGHGEYYTLLLVVILGMVVLAGSQNLVTLFVGFEVLSIPLYVLCAAHLRRERSLESGLKYLIIGSVGSATLLYGLALLYGATGSTDFREIAAAVDAAGLTGDPMFLTSIALVMAGLAFKASVAPFHQWTPDVYEGAPTPVTAFMAVATKAAALAIVVRLFEVAVIDAASIWAPALAALAVITIVVGNVGAIGQSSVKRILAYSSVAQAGYMLVGVIVTTQLGIAALVFYLFAYVIMNLAAFAVVVARERTTGLGDDLSSLRGLGTENQWLAWPMTIAMLALAGFPATMGFFGKIYLIRAAVDNDWAWLGVAIVIGSAISLVYYLRVVAAVWMRAPEKGSALAARPAARPVMAGGSPEADALLGDADVASRRHAPGDEASAAPEAVVVAVLCAAATIAFGIFPQPLFDVAREVGEVFTHLI